MMLPALLLGGMWWLRNTLVYGWPDFMGLMRHDAVVVGQPRTMDAIARDGLMPFLLSAFRTVFQSYWGQFGWMGVVLDNRIYRGLIVLTFSAVFGVIVLIVDTAKEQKPIKIRDEVVFLGVSAAITVVMFIGYNISFIQHQGRYIFPALPVWAILMGLGLQYLLNRKVAMTYALSLLALIIILGLWGVIIGDIQFWWLLILGVALFGTASILYIPQQFSTIYGVGLLGALACLDVVCLFGFIVPMLSVY
jgi:hypothetical protein